MIRGSSKSLRELSVLRCFKRKERMKNDPEKYREERRVKTTKCRERRRERRVRDPNYRERYYQKHHVRRRKYREKIRELTLEFFGKKCCKCGFSDVRALQVDHINGNGHKESKLFGYGALKLLKRIKEAPEKYQLLCANCNWIKKYENREIRKIRGFPNKRRTVIVID